MSIGTIEQILNINSSLSPVVYTIDAELTNVLDLSGTLSKINTIEANLEKLDVVTVNSLTNCFSLSKTENITGDISYGNFLITDGIDYYSEGYSVTPSAISQTVNTKNKILLNDITVNEIPVLMASNESDGYTITIG